MVSIEEKPSLKDIQIITLNSENIADYGVCGYKDVKKHVELRKKIEWYKEYHPKGLRIKALLSDLGGYQGMIEYIPGEYAHRPIDAEGYMFIHCVFVGFKKEFKGKGYGSLMIDECIKDSIEADMKGVTVVTRKGSFMAKKDIFLKKGFTVVDKAKPDFELLVLKFDEDFEDPKFRDMERSLDNYKDGLYIIRSVQCPYTEKNVNEMVETAENKYGLKAKVVDLKSVYEVQNSPCPFGTFCVIYDGEIISHHPISNTRFENIMEKKKILT